MIIEESNDVYICTKKEDEIMDLKNLQKEVYQNKVDKGFNVTDVNKEFCFLYGEVAESYEAYRKRRIR